MNHRQTYSAVIVYFLSLVLLASVASAQSKDRDNPTRLTSNTISGLVDSDSRGNHYYYSFMANPGEVVITLTVDPGKAANSSDEFYGVYTGASFSLFDRNAAELVGKTVITSSKGLESKQAVARVEITRRQLVTLSIYIENRYMHTSVGGKWRIRIEGEAEFRQGGIDLSDFNPNNSASKDKTNSSNCFPKQGTLIIKMKDGSKKIIDLSEAEDITVVP